MKFSEYEYTRPDISEIKKLLEEKAELLTKLSTKEQIAAINEVETMMEKVSSMMQLVSIRSSINTTDEFYKQETKYFNENEPLLEDSINNFNRAIIKNVDRNLLITTYGELYVKKIENSLNLFTKEIIPFLQEENELNMQYQELTAGLKVTLFDKEITIIEASAYLENSDREIRKKAYLEIQKVYAAHEETFDKIYDRLVKIRHEIATTLGFKNYLEYKYLAYERFDYTYQDIAKYRKAIVKNIIPVAKKLLNARKRRLSLNKLFIYDGLKFKNGNPKPIGTPTELVAKANTMYHEMNEETGNFFNMMTKTEQMDLLSKPGKAPGGYCTYLPYFKTPFIFANFNGTSADVDVLTHEAGHAFQVYSARNLISSYHWPTLEACEIHSMSMEFLAWPWMESFFDKDANNYRFMHLEDSFLFLPYGCLVDHFQEQVFLHPTYTPAQRKALWAKLEKKYLPYLNYDNDEFGKKGTRWYRQHHIFAIPLYYIDYTLAQVCAFQFWHLDQINHEDALSRYIDLCKLGGSKTFLELIKSVNLLNPMAGHNLSQILKPVINYLISQMNSVKE